MLYEVITNGVWLTGAIADVVSFLITAVFMLKEMKRLEECHELQMCSI